MYSAIKGDRYRSDARSQIIGESDLLNFSVRILTHSHFNVEEFKYVDFMLGLCSPLDSR